MTDTCKACRDVLLSVTPLAMDCGLLCSHACCASLEGEETGMLLFPGEADAYQDKPGWKLLPSNHGELVICPGHCSREERPLSCRLFPLLPVLRGDTVKVVMDSRARAICPLAQESIRSQQPAFIEAVRTCGQLLAADPATRLFLEQLTAQQDELKALQKHFTGGTHV